MKALMELKSLRGFQLKADDQGVVVMKFAELNTIDRDGDIIRPGAIGTQSVKVSKWGHGGMWENALPVGKGTTKESGNDAIAELLFFLDVPDGRDAFTVLKHFGSDQEWSFGYRVEGWEVPSEEERQRGAYRVLTKLHVFEVSPVMIGAGIGTETISAKAAAAQVEQKRAADEAAAAAAAETSEDPPATPTPEAAPDPSTESSTAPATDPPASPDPAKAAADALEAAELAAVAEFKSTDVVIRAAAARVEAAQLTAEAKAHQAEEARIAAELDAELKTFEATRARLSRYAHWEPHAS